MTQTPPNYHLDALGVLHQTRFQPKVYDAAYLSYYEGLHERTIKLGYLRFGWLCGTIKRLPANLLEIGYGLGTFLEAARAAGVADCAGTDVARYPLPTGCRFVEWDDALSRPWDAVGLFDVLEHIPDLSFLTRLQTPALAIAVPHCRWRERGNDWFEHWRMRLPDEHLHHFDPDSLVATLEYYGFRCLDLNTYEDGLRRRPGEGEANIVCGLFAKSG